MCTFLYCIFYSTTFYKKKLNYTSEKTIIKRLYVTNMEQPNKVSHRVKKKKKKKKIAEGNDTENFVQAYLNKIKKMEFQRYKKQAWVQVHEHILFNLQPNYIMASVLA